MTRKSISSILLPLVHLLYRSEEDNDPLTDDGASTMSPPVSARLTRAAHHGIRSSARVGRHQLASSMLSDDGADSQTYDGDVEFSVTAGAGQHPSSKGFLNLHHSSSASTLTSQNDDMVPSPSTSQLLDPPQGARPVTAIEEPAPTGGTTVTFNPAALSPEDIQSFVRRAIEGVPGRAYHINPPPSDRPVRIFADGICFPSYNRLLQSDVVFTGVYDLFHFG